MIHLRVVYRICECSQHLSRKFAMIGVKSIPFRIVTYGTTNMARNALRAEMPSVDGMSGHKQPGPGLRPRMGEGLMHSARKVTAIAGAALSALVLVGLLLVPSSTARAGPPEPRELPALREAPDIPVGSIFLRRELPGHPLPPPVEREFPGPDAPGLEGRAAEAATRISI